MQQPGNMSQPTDRSTVVRVCLDQNGLQLLSGDVDVEVLLSRVVTMPGNRVSTGVYIGVNTNEWRNVS